MRILFVVHAYKPAWRVGGPIHSVSALAEHLVGLGIEVHVYTSDSNLDQKLDITSNVPLVVNGVFVTYFRTLNPYKYIFPFSSYFNQSIGPLFSPKYSSTLFQTIRSFDIVHTHLPFNYLSLMAAIAAFANNVPLVYHQRGVLDPARLEYRALKKQLYINLFEKRIMRRAKKLIALTKYEKDVYSMYAPKTPCSLIPNGITLPVDDCRTPEHIEYLSFLSIKSYHQVVLFMGRLHPTKGAELLIHAFSKAASRVPNILLVICGPDEHGLEAGLRELARDLMISNQVVFPGMVSGFKKTVLLQRSNLFCLPSVAEGFSIAILEALSYSTPVLISEGCHFPEVKESKAGWIFRLTENDCAYALTQALSNPRRLKAYGENARDLVIRSYQWPQIADQFVNLYESILHDNPGLDLAAQR